MRHSGLFLAGLLTSLAITASAMKTEIMTLPRGTGVTAGPGGAPLTLEVVSEQAMIRISTPSVLHVLAAAGYPTLADFSSIHWALVGLPAGVPVPAGLDFLKVQSGVMDVTPNRVLVPLRVPNDPQVNSQSALSQIDAPGGWDFEVGTSCRATVVIVDSGIEGTHQDLSSKIVNSAPAVSQYCQADGSVACVATPAPTPACNHATRVAGVAAAASDNSAGVAGVSWGAQLLSIKVFDDGSCNTVSDCPIGCSTSDAALVRAVNFASGVQNTEQAGKVVVNMSVGCTPGSGGCLAACNGALQAALNAAAGLGIVTTISAGNDGGPVNNPAICAGTVSGSGIIPVGSVNSLNALSSFSSRGAELAANGVVAPGESVLTTNIGNGYTGGATGTSFSAPHVAGLAALVLSAKPSFTAAQVQTAIRGGADNVGLSSSLQGAGRINVFKTMRIATRGSLAGFDGQAKPVAFPNPFRGGAVSFAIPPGLQGSGMSIKIYTLDGTPVRTVTGLSWDGKNTQGNRVASGTYVFIVKSSAGTGSGRVSVLQ